MAIGLIALTILDGAFLTLMIGLHRSRWAHVIEAKDYIWLAFIASIGFGFHMFGINLLANLMARDGYAYTVLTRATIMGSFVVFGAPPALAFSYLCLRKTTSTNVTVHSSPEQFPKAPLLDVELMMNKKQYEDALTRCRRCIVAYPDAECIDSAAGLSAGVTRSRSHGSGTSSDGK